MSNVVPDIIIMLLNQVDKIVGFVLNNAPHY